MRNHLDPNSLRHLTSSTPIWIHEKQLLMNFLPCRRHLTPILVYQSLDKLDLLAIQIQRVFEFKWITYLLCLLALSILCATYHTRERVSHEIFPYTKQPHTFSSHAQVDRDELVLVWIQIWFEFKCVTTCLYPLTRIRHVLNCFKRDRELGHA